MGEGLLSGEPVKPDENNASDLKNILTGAENEPGPDFVSSESEKKRQNVILISVGVIVVLVIGLAVWQMGRTLKLPLPITGKEEPAVQSAKDSLDLSTKTSAELKAADTDADKINDFEELYVYDTSPYLVDSDSDGIDDFDEIANHTDPTCAEGKNCFSVGAAAAGGATGSTVGMTEVSAADLRSLLVQSGKVTAEQAAAIDDATLLEIYGQTLEQNPDLVKKLPAGQPAIGVPVDTIADQAKNSDEAITALGSISATTIRQMLLEQGFSEAELKKIDDKTLINLYQAALEKASAKENGNKK